MIDDYFELYKDLLGIVGIEPIEEFVNIMTEEVGIEEAKRLASEYTIHYRNSRLLKIDD